MHRRAVSGTGNPSGMWDSALSFMLPVGAVTKPTPWGPGMAVPVSAAANSSVIVTHGLGRLVRAVICLSNNGGANFTPRLKWGATLPLGISTPQQITVQGDEAMANAVLAMW